MKGYQAVTALAKKVFYVSLGIGCLLFVLFFTVGKSNQESLVLFGLLYVLLAVFVNSMIVLYYLLRIVVDKNTRKQSFYSIGLLLLNVPIASGYLYLIIISI